VSTASPGPAPFLIYTALGDGEVVEIPALDLAELDRLLGRMSRVCAEAEVKAPATVVWRLDRGAPRRLSRAELEECDIARHTVLAD
jgi:hypothetical protein